MTGNDLRQMLDKYLGEYPQFEHNDIIVSIPRKRRDTKGDFYRRFKITSIGFNSLVSKDGLDLGIEPVD